MEPSELWSDASPLDEAWWFLGLEEHKVQYRSAGHNAHLTNFLKVTMRRDLIHSIYNGELLCLGIEIAPNLGSTPEIVPRHLFANPDVDWVKSTMRAFGRTYEGLRVVSPDKAVAIESSKPTRQPPAGDQLGEVASSSPTQAPLRGRPTVGDQLREVVGDLTREGKFEGISRKEQVNRIRSRARERYPNLFPTETQPSRTKILEALKAEGGYLRSDPRPKSP